ncbi:hypothetical protein ABZ917_37490 [Nonomuraea wenchangensis]
MELDGPVERTLVVDSSTAMHKKTGPATALLHGPRLLVLDEPFEAVDPVWPATIKQILNRFVRVWRLGADLQPRHGLGRAVVKRLMTRCTRLACTGRQGSAPSPRSG